MDLMLSLAEASAGRSDTVFWVFVGVGALVGIIFVGTFARLASLWIQAAAAGVGISLFDLIGMRLRRVKPQAIVLARIQAVRRGLDLATSELERHWRAGGRPVEVVRALILAEQAGLDLSWQQAAAMDLAGHDVLKTVGRAVKTRVVEKPDGGAEIVLDTRPLQWQ
jgi:uncharacterized protein YqfA (UPF0365 family)